MKVNRQLHIPANLTRVKDPSVYIREATGRDLEPTWAFWWKFFLSSANADAF